MADEITTQEKTVEQFRQEIIDNIFRAISNETNLQVSFTEKGDYLNVKLNGAKIEGLHKALSIVLDASTINVKEG